MSPRLPETRGAAGFTLTEVLVSLLIFTVLVIGLLTVFDVNSRIARVETHVADLQQSLRVTQHEMVRSLRMTGRGGLPVLQHPNPLADYDGKLLPVGVALEVLNNAGADVELGDCDCAKVLPGTDVLTIRGVFSSPIYQVNPLSTDYVVDGDDGRVTVSATSPTGVPQSLQALKEAIDDTKAGRPEPLLLVSPLDDGLFAVVELTGASSYDDASASLEFKVSGGERTEEYLKLMPNGVFPPDLTSIAYIGVLKEHRFYVRELWSDPVAKAGDLTPRFTRARLYPGTNEAWGDAESSLIEDVADNVLDLQVALGVDLDGNQLVVEGETAEARKADEWLFNAVGDKPEEIAVWNGTPAAPRRVYYVRVSTLARTDRRDPKYRAPDLTLLEDKDYGAASYDYNARAERMFRRQLLQTLVDLRNLS